MDVLMQQHRMKRWLVGMFVVLSLVTSCWAQAAATCVSWMNSNLPSNRYPTQLELAQAVISYLDSKNHNSSVLTGCDGVSSCYYTWRSPYNGVVYNAMFGTWCTAYGAPISISIEPVGTLPDNGTYSILPSATLPLNAVVKDQNGVVQGGKQVTITANVQDGTGGHLHAENRPKGVFTCSSSLTAPPATCTLTTDYSGQAPFIFVSTPVSGTHTITATCAGCGNTATAPVNVKVADLMPIPASPLYALTDLAGAVIGAIPGKHTANHHLTATAISKLGDLANIYTKVNPNAKLYLNDASLVWGGLFDVGNSTPWSSPHSLHDKGASLDIRAANSGPNNEGAVPATLFAVFLDKSRRKGFKIGLHCRNSSDTTYCLGQPNNRHFHVDF